MTTKRIWIPYGSKGKKSKITDAQKNAVTIFFEPLVRQFKKELQKRETDKQYNYTVDIYTKWYQNFFYFCEKNISESGGKITGEFETKFVRLAFVSENNFNFSYFRHTGQWHLVIENISLGDCLEMIIGNPNFQPIY